MRLRKQVPVKKAPYAARESAPQWHLPRAYQRMDRSGGCPPHPLEWRIPSSEGEHGSTNRHTHSTLMAFPLPPRPGAQSR